MMNLTGSVGDRKEIPSASRTSVSKSEEHASVRLLGNMGKRVPTHIGHDVAGIQLPPAMPNGSTIPASWSGRVTLPEWLLRFKGIDVLRKTDKIIWAILAVLVLAVLLPSLYHILTKAPRKKKSRTTQFPHVRSKSPDAVGSLEETADTLVDGFFRWMRRSPVVMQAMDPMRVEHIQHGKINITQAWVYHLSKLKRFMQSFLRAKNGDTYQFRTFVSASNVTFIGLLSILTSAGAYGGRLEANLTYIEVELIPQVQGDYTWTLDNYIIWRIDEMRILNITEWSGPIDPLTTLAAAAEVQDFKEELATALTVEMDKRIFRLFDVFMKQNRNER